MKIYETKHMKIDDIRLLGLMAPIWLALALGLQIGGVLAAWQHLA